MLPDRLGTLAPNRFCLIVLDPDCFGWRRRLSEGVCHNGSLAPSFGATPAPPTLFAETCEGTCRVSS